MPARMSAPKAAGCARTSPATVGSGSASKIARSTSGSSCQPRSTSTRHAPARARRARAARKASSTAASRPSQKPRSSTPTRRPASGAGAWVRGAAPHITSSSTAQSATEARERADVIERRAQRQDTLERHAAEARHQPHDPAEGGRGAHRAPRVGPAGEVHEARGHGHGRARGRAARYALGIVGMRAGRRPGHWPLMPQAS